MICKSLTVFRSALEIVEEDSEKELDLTIDLIHGRKPIASAPRTIAELKQHLSITPPSLVLFQKGNYFSRRVSIPITHVSPFPREELEQQGFNSEDVSCYFVELKYANHSFPRYLLLQPCTAPAPLITQ